MSDIKVEATGQVVVSPKDQLVSMDYKIWFQRGFLLFGKPLIAMYLAFAVGEITLDIANQTFELSTKYFIPNSLVIGGMILFVLNRITDLLNRYEKKITYKV